MEIQCVHCRKTIDVKDDTAEGSRVRCPFCEGKFEYSGTKTIGCELCGKEIDIPCETLPGSKVKCPFCGEKFAYAGHPCAGAASVETKERPVGEITDADLRNAILQCRKDPVNNRYYSNAPAGARLYIGLLFYGMVYRSVIDTGKYLAAFAEIEPELNAEDVRYLLRFEDDGQMREYLENLLLFMPGTEKSRHGVVSSLKVGIIKPRPVQEEPGPRDTSLRETERKTVAENAIRRKLEKIKKSEEHTVDLNAEAIKRRKHDGNIAVSAEKANAELLARRFWRENVVRSLVAGFVTVLLIGAGWLWIDAENEKRRLRREAMINESQCNENEEPRLTEHKKDNETGEKNYRRLENKIQKLEKLLNQAENRIEQRYDKSQVQASMVQIVPSNNILCAVNDNAIHQADTNRNDCNDIVSWEHRMRESVARARNAGVLLYEDASVEVRKTLNMTAQWICLPEKGDMYSVFERRGDDGVSRIYRLKQGQLPTEINEGRLEDLINEKGCLYLNDGHAFLRRPKDSLESDIQYPSEKNEGISFAKCVYKDSATILSALNLDPPDYVYDVMLSVRIAFKRVEVKVCEIDFLRNIDDKSVYKAVEQLLYAHKCEKVQEMPIKLRKPKVTVTFYDKDIIKKDIRGITHIPREFDDTVAGRCEREYRTVFRYGNGSRCNCSYCKKERKVADAKRRWERLRDEADRQMMELKEYEQKKTEILHKAKASITVSRSEVERILDYARISFIKK